VAQPIVISGALANVRGAVDTEQLLKFLAEEAPGVDFYKATGVMGAAIDWRGILQDAATVATIAGLLFTAYTTLIEPGKKDPKSDAGIVVVVQEKGDKPVQFWIGKDYKDREIFIEEFTKEVTRIRKSEEGPSTQEQIIEETKRSGYWIKIK